MDSPGRQSPLSRPRSPACRPVSKSNKTQAWGCILFVLAIVSVLLGLYYAGRLVVTPAGVTGSSSLWPSWSVGLVVDRFSLADLARDLGQEASTRRTSDTRFPSPEGAWASGGRRFENGPITIWASGPSDPIPMLLEQIELVRGRFSALLGRQIEPRAPLRIYWFDKRDSLESYHRELVVSDREFRRRLHPRPRQDDHNFPRGQPFPAERARAMGPLPGRLLLARDGRGISAPVLVARGGRIRPRRECVKARNSHVSTAECSDRCGVGGPWAPLISSRSRRKPWSSRAGAGPTTISFTKLSQWSPQSWSVGEYLVGGESTEEHRARSVAFLNDLNSSDRQEEVFERHFGYRYDRLLEDWRKWVLDHGEGTHGPPAAAIRDVLINELIPTIRNSQANEFERIHAVRMMGMEGYAMGADTLIDLLRTGGEIPREELVWALESISGLTLGDDPEAWTAWWEGVPEQARCLTP